MNKVIRLSGADLGPTNAAQGSELIVDWSDKTEIFVREGKKWVLKRTVPRRRYL